MEYTFNYDVDTTNTEVLVSQVSFKEKLTPDEEERLIASFKTGNYYTLDEDDSIRDIYDRIFDMAVQFEEQQPYGADLESELKLVNFTYPPECR